MTAAAAASFAHAYDADGNTLQADGRWNLLWDAENRLTQAVTTPAAINAGVPDLRLTFGYEAQGRRVSKKVEKRAGATSSWEVLKDIRFIYEGWNLVAEVELRLTAYDAPAPGGRPHLLRSYTWGPDLSGSLTGAGGVGGLLGLTRHERGVSPADSYWATSDLNGNVIGLSAVSTVRHALYEYNAFGSPVRVNEPEPELNPMRFSSKYTDVETNWLYYGYRYYNPELGRWLSRDPIEEQGGINLYGMVSNDPVNSWDYLGLVERLTRKEAQALHCGLKKYLSSIIVRGGGRLLGYNWAPKAVKNYIDKGPDLFWPVRAINGTSLFKLANNAAIEAIVKNGQRTYTHFGGRFTEDDQRNSLGGVQIEYTASTNSVAAQIGQHVNGRIYDEFTFKPNNLEKGLGLNVPLPLLSKWANDCGWCKGDTISDVWMEDLERYELAKSFFITVEWKAYATGQTIHELPPLGP